jgi:hypothetical protein
MAFYKVKILGSLSAGKRSRRKRSRSRGLHGLDGAVKICLRYAIGQSGKLRCSQWGSGPGYAEGPYSRDDYFIPFVRNSAGIKRKYRYRRSLPYPPIEDDNSVRTQAKYIELPDETRSGIVRIVMLPLASKRLPKDT